MSFILWNKNLLKLGAPVVLVGGLVRFGVGVVVVVVVVSTLGCVVEGVVVGGLLSNWKFSGIPYFKNHFQRKKIK